MTLDDWIGEKPEVRYFMVERRGSGDFEARLGTDDMSDEVPFPGVGAPTIAEAVAGLMARFLD